MEKNINQISLMNPLQSLQSLVQFTLYDKIKSGNEIIDTLVMLCSFTLITMIITNIPVLLNYIKNRCFESMYSVRHFISYVYRKLKKEKKIYEKNVEVCYLTPTKQPNYLFIAVHWFLTKNDNELNFIKEQELSFTYEDKIKPDNTSVKNDSYKLNKIIKQKRWKDIVYNNCTISYMLDSNIVTIFNSSDDQERKRENFIIYLRTYIDDYTTTDIMDNFCRFCVSEFYKSQISSVWEQQIYTNKGDKWEVQPSKNQRIISTVILKDGYRENIYSDLKLFLRSENWYKTRGIPYSRGYLFYGTPGTGKTSMIKALSNECKRHIHFLNLSLIDDDKQLIDLLKGINYNETILVIEDIDCFSEVVKSRTKPAITDHHDEGEGKNVVRVVIQQPKREEHLKKSNLTLSGILNSLDGIFNNDGRILIVTTNHPEILDEALIRPGRIDIKIPFTNCDTEQIKNLYEIFFEEKCPTDIVRTIIPEKYSPADVISTFLCNRNDPTNALRILAK